jgi:hypothetical protein
MNIASGSRVAVLLMVATVTSTALLESPGTVTVTSTSCGPPYFSVTSTSVNTRWCTKTHCCGVVCFQDAVTVGEKVRLSGLAVSTPGLPKSALLKP